MKTVSNLTTGFVLTAFIASDSWALELGDLAIYSYLNEPFSAQIELLDADDIDEGDLQISLAPDAEVDRFNVSRGVYLTKIRFDIEVTERGKFVTLRTLTPLREPYLDFIVEARWSAGRLLKDYQVVIDLPPEPSLSQGDVGDIALTDLSQATDTVTSGAATAQRDYVKTALVQPKPGSAYLVKTTDTLWSIATKAAPDNATIEQTMLAIVAQNPIAFLGQNINGLESGYLLLLPENAEGMFDPITAIAEVARQNMEWRQGLAISESGLRPVTDVEVAGELTSPEPGQKSGAPVGVTVDQQVGITDATGKSISADQAKIASLMATNTDLKADLEGARSELAEKDAELIKLRAALSERHASLFARSQAVQPDRDVKSRVVEMIGPFWPWIAGGGATLLGLFVMGWIGSGRSRQAKEVSSSSAQITGDAPYELPERDSHSDSDARASRILEEVETFKASGRNDQAIEVLSEAVNDGLAPPVIVLCLLECYVKSGRAPEAKTLIDKLVLSENDDLLCRANQIMAGASYRPPFARSEASGEASSEDRSADEKRSVLGKFSVSKDPELASTFEVSALTLASLEEDVPVDNRVSDESESIYGLEADPMDSQLDLARAYIDMGDDEGARPVLMTVIKEGSHSQEAEARELLLRIEVT